MEERFNKTWLFSHNDLDGYACNIVSRAILLEYTSELVEMNCDYSKIDNKIRECMPEIDKENDLVIVSDISWNKTSTDITDFMKSIPEGHLVIADHHKSSEWIGKEIESNFIHTVEGSLCGCQILMHLLTVMGFHCTDKIRNDLVWFTDTVGDWDLWKWADKPEVQNQTSVGNLLYQPAPHLSAWFEWEVKYFGTMDFVETVMSLMMEKRKISFGLSEKYLDSGFKEYLKQTRDTLYDASRHYYRFTIPSYRVTRPFARKDLEALLFVLPEGCQQKSLLSMIANNNIKKSGYRDYDCIAIWVEGDENISLRYPTRGTDLSDALKTCCWGGGGHKEQAGTIPGRSYMEEICKWNTLWNL